MAFFSRKERFNRYFEGYEKRTKYDKNGNESSKFVYVGDYFSPELSKGAFAVRKIINIALFLAACAAQLLAGIAENIPMNHSKLSGISQALAILALIVSAVYIVIHLAAPYRMEIHSYKGAHNNFIIAQPICAAVLAAVFLSALVSTFIYADGFSFIYVLWNCAYLFSAACVLVIWLLEKKTTYSILPPDHF